MPESSIPSTAALQPLWDAAASTKTFRHPWPEAFLTPYLAEPQDLKVLDVGCGQGRIVKELRARGMEVSGTDTSDAMLEKAGKECPESTFRRLVNGRIPWDDNSFNVASLLTVLTAVPGRQEQSTLISECLRVLEPGGLLFVSDLPLQWDVRHRLRYEAGLAKYGEYGVWDFPDGGTVRHHGLAYFRELVAALEELAMEEFPVTTMNGNPARAFRYVGRKRRP